MSGEAWRLLLLNSHCVAALQHPDAHTGNSETDFWGGGLSKPALQNLSVRVEL